jgi:hypothetical protein
MKHKWAKEIKAWADGAEIEWCYMAEPFGIWQTVTSPNWDSTNLKYRIKPQPKEPQYLYVYCGMAGDVSLSRTKYDSCIGKIKLETEDES